jgi:hypothetical protein
VPKDQAATLAERFRPWLKFDSKEAWRPLNVTHLLAERKAGIPAHRFCKRLFTPPDCAPIGNEAEFERQAGNASVLGAATYIDLAGEKRKDYRGPGQCGNLADCGSSPGSAIYYHVTQSNNRFYIDYWWFLRYNNFYKSGPGLSCKSNFARANGICDEHEGDWEGVTVVTSPGHDNQLDYWSMRPTRERFATPERSSDATGHGQTSMWRAAAMPPTQRAASRAAASRSPFRVL